MKVLFTALTEIQYQKTRTEVAEQDKRQERYQKAILQAYADIGDIILDYLRVIKNYIKTDFALRIGEFCTIWVNNGCPEQPRVETTYIRGKIAVLYPNIQCPSIEFEEQYRNIAYSIAFYSRRCARSHDDIRKYG